MAQTKLWLLKYKNGRIQGPLSAKEIIELIQTQGHSWGRNYCGLSRGPLEAHIR